MDDLEKGNAARKLCLAVDAACDLPKSLVTVHAVEILPVYLKTERKIFVDVRDPVETLSFYQKELSAKHFAAETFPFPARSMSERMEQELIEKWDDVLVMTINSARSEIYQNVREAIATSIAKFKNIRHKAGNQVQFKMHIFDTGTMFTGQAVLAHEALRLIDEEGLGPRQVMARLEMVKKKVHAYVLPNDLYFLKNVASTKGDKSVGWLSYKIGNMLDIKPIIHCYRGETKPWNKAKALGFEKGLEKLFTETQQAILVGLSIKMVAMSYAGPLKDIEDSRSYHSFEAFLTAQNITHTLAVMSMTAAINVGAKAFSIAYAEA